MCIIINNHKIVVVARVADHWGPPQVTVKELEGSTSNLIRTSKRKMHMLTKDTGMASVNTKNWYRRESDLWA
jgi:hypothetical protein